MSAEEILAELEQRGVRLEIDGDQLRYRAPRGALTDELRGAVARNKVGIVNLLRGRNGYSAGGPAETVIRAFEAQARRTPDAAAILSGSQLLSYAELNARANRLAHYLRRQGVGPDVFVGVCLDPSPEMVVAVLGVLKAGGAYVPLDPGYPKERLASMFEDAGLPLLVTRQGLLPTLPEAAALRAVCLDADWDRLAGEPEGDPAAGAAAGNRVYAIFTSGSTGGPKLAVVHHCGFANLLRWFIAEFGITDSDRVLLVSSFNFDLTQKNFFAPLMTGGRLYLPQAAGFSPAEIVDAVADNQITLLNCTPSAFYLLADAAAEGGFAALRSLRHVFLGGEPISLRRLRGWLSFPDCRGEVVNTYGPTECADICAFYRLKDPGQISDIAPVPIGRAIPNAKLYVLDAHMGLVPPGAKGELYIGGVGVGEGYFNTPARTAAKFVPDSFDRIPGARLYRTGDVVRYLPDGSLDFLGRVDNQVKVRGFRIELGEIESTLASHPDVKEAVVVAREDVPGDKRLVAYVVGKGEQPLSSRNLRRHAQAKLPDYMVPSHYVLLKSLPLNPNGKVNRQALPAPDPAQDEPALEYVPPSTPAEATLAAILAELLGRERVGVHDNFFELGGDSILAIQAISRANRAGLRLSPRHLFQHQTIAELAVAVETAPVIEAEQGEVTGPVPLTPIQHFFFERDFPEPHHFNQALLLEVGQPLDASLLERAVRHLLAHHDALRLRFTRGPAGWKQVNVGVQAAAEPSAFSYTDLGDLPEMERVAALEAAAASCQAGLNLSAGPLVRVVLFGMGGGSDRLLMAIHHLVVDAFSWGILLEDLTSAYEQLRAGREVEFPPKTTSFRRWAERLPDYARSDAVGREVDFWKDLAARQSVSLPLDHPDGVNDLASAETLMASLDAEETRALLQDVPVAYRTHVHEVLLATLAQAFGAWTGRRSLLLGLEGHGREELFDDVDVSRTVGWFTSLFPVWLDLGTNDHPGEILKSVKEQLRQVPRRGVGFGLLRNLRGEPDLVEALQPLAPQVGFNYLGRLDQALPESAQFRLAKESAGPAHGQRGLRHLLFEINCGVSGGRFQVSWTYGRNVHDRETVTRLSESFLAALLGVIAHCQSPDAFGYTPSDFPLAGLDQAALDRVVGEDRWVEDIYPLTPMQKALLYHSVLAPDSDAYFGQVSCTFTSGFRPDAFRRAWEKMLERHPVLRTRFAWKDSPEPVQVVQRHVTLRWEEFDWRGLGPGEQEDCLQVYLKKDRLLGFDMGRAPLVRLALARLSEDSWKFISSLTHLLVDGWSLPLLLKDAMLLYAGFAHGREVALEPPPQYRDYIAWLKEQDPARGEAFWRKALQGFKAPMSLVLPGPAGPPVEGPAYRRQERRLSEAVTQSLTQLARHHHVTLNVLVQGAWALLLSRYSGEREVVFGATVSGRSGPVPGLKSMLGLFINTIPVRSRVDPGSTVAGWLRAMQEEQADAHQYEHCSLADVQRWSELPRGVPLFESIFSFDNYPIDRSLRQQTLAVGIEDVRVDEHSEFPLAVVVGPAPELLLRVGYSAHRFHDAAVARVLDDLECVLTAFLRDPERRLAEIDLLTGGERRQVLSGWNDTALEFPAGACVHQLFEAQVARTPDAPAVVSSRESLSYRELNARANRLAHRLRGYGVGPEVRVGLCLERSPELVVGMFATLKAGGVYVPLDPGYPRDRVGYMLEDAGVQVLLTQERLSTQLARDGVQVICLDAGLEPAAGEDDKDCTTPVAPDNLAYVLYTSGSTGRPKGVMITHRALVNFLCWSAREFPLAERDRVLQKTPVSFDASVWEFYAPLLAGARLVVALPDGHRDVGYMTGAVAEHGITAMKFVPSLLRVFLDSDRLSGSCSTLERVLCGGEALPPDLRDRFAERLPDCKLHNVYGPAEATVNAIHWPCAGRGEDGLVPIGRPVANVRAYVLDPDLNPVPPGIPGELHLAGEGLARGYLNRPALTAEKFIPDPFGAAAGERLYRTADRCRWLPDGTLDFLGRVDHQVKLRGYRIELGEVEAVMMQHPGVAQAVAAVREDQPGGSQLVAYIVPAVRANGERALGDDDLKNYLKERLPDYMVPSAFATLEAIPLNPSGKVDRRALLAASVAAAPASRREFVAPRDELEQRLARIWEELLEVKPVGVTDNFFELGGHSILAVQLMVRIESEFQQTVPLAVLMQGDEQRATVETLARVLREQSGAQHWSSLVKIQSSGSRVPFFCVHPGGGNVMAYFELAQRLGPDQPFYGLQAVGLDGCQEPLGSVEEMASHYVEAIRQVCPQGPYLLGGHSAGGPIAVAVGQRLRREGDPVALVAVLDAAPPDFYRAMARVNGEHAQDDAERLAGIATVMEKFFHKKLGVTPEALRDLGPDEQLRHFLESLQTAEVGPPGADVTMLRGLLNTLKGIHRAVLAYWPDNEPRLPIALFRSSDRLEGLPPELGLVDVEDPALGWGVLSSGPVPVYTFPGDHIGMLTSPHVDALAERLRLCIDESLASGGGTGCASAGEVAEVPSR